MISCYLSVVRSPTIRKNNLGYENPPSETGSARGPLERAHTVSGPGAAPALANQIAPAGKDSFRRIYESSSGAGADRSLGCGEGTGFPETLPASGSTIRAIEGTTREGAGSQRIMNKEKLRGTHGRPSSHGVAVRTPLTVASRLRGCN